MIRWLYLLILALDANFRMKRRMVSNDLVDPGLTTGLAYFVEEKAYRAHLSKYGDQHEARLLPILTELHADRPVSDKHLFRSCCNRPREY